MLRVYLGLKRALSPTDNPRPNGRRLSASRQSQMRNESVTRGVALIPRRPITHLLFKDSTGHKYLPRVQSRFAFGELTATEVAEFQQRLDLENT